jgi:hypothetical protein
MYSLVLPTRYLLFFGAFATGFPRFELGLFTFYLAIVFFTFGTSVGEVKIFFGIILRLTNFRSVNF